jgi:alkanesulfonate monooxygenase SsuD/methylene tetrahydromethanopterin reductase-like flavin-dependent oxidoreductase (luciferase family)
VATLGQGWFGFNLTPAALEERLETLDVLLADAGRSREDIQVYVSPAAEATNRDDVRAFASLGVEQVIVGVFAGSAARLKERAERMLSLV